MVTLSKRATPLQQQLFRIIEGAIKNASDAHPEQKVSDQMARSIAKRAVGTISAHLAGMLADETVKPE